MDSEKRKYYHSGEKPLVGDLIIRVQDTVVIDGHPVSETFEGQVTEISKDGNFICTKDNVWLMPEKFRLMEF